jgi:hypothetical protein
VGAVGTHAWVGAGNWKHAAEPTIAAVKVVALRNFMVLRERNEDDDDDDDDLLSK